MTVVASPDDETLVRLSREGSRSACEELFQRHRAVAYRVAFRLLNNEQDALDAVQDGFLKAFLALADFDGRSVFRTWLIRIVSNAAIDLGRKRNRRSALNSALTLVFGKSSGEGATPNRNEPATDEDPSQGLHNDDLRKALDRALGQLSVKVRTTFVLFAEAGLSYKEIAESQDVPIGTVMSRLSYARQKLQGITELQDLDDR